MTTTAPLPDFDALWDYNDPAGTEQRFRALTPLAETAGGSYYVEWLTQVARTQGLQRQFEAAQHTLDQAEALLAPSLHRAYVRVLLERGRVFRSAQNVTAARPLFLEALRLAEAHGEESLAVDAAHMLGIIGSPEEQMAWNLRALALAEQATDPQARQWRGSLYNNIGWTYHETGEYDRALDMFEKAVAFRGEQGDAGKIRIARWCVARCLRSLGRLEEALAQQQALVLEDADDGYIHEEMGECLLALGRADEARPAFAQAYALLSQDPWLVAEQKSRLDRLRTLAGL